MSSKRAAKPKSKEPPSIQPNDPPTKQVAGIYAPAILQRLAGSDVSAVPPLLLTGATTTLLNEGGTQNIGQCRCLKSRCLKLYCECFSSGILCTTACKCETTCQNNDNTEENRDCRNKAIMQNVKADPNTFRRRQRYSNTAKPSKSAGISAPRAPGLSCSCSKTQCLKVCPFVYATFPFHGTLRLVMFVRKEILLLFPEWKVLWKRLLMPKL